MRGRVRGIDAQSFRELGARRVVVVAVVRLHARGDDAFDFLFDLATLCFGALDAFRGLLVRDVDQKNARLEIDRLLIFAGIECAIAVGDVLIDFLLVVGTRLDRCSGKIEVARRLRRRCRCGVETERAR